ncbi:MAG: microviridin/marinostatin family tricyclic proteinase inhibitor [Deltaproteobacteria bacterium]|nr:microviridin/marinostatin family tricyclic proteinase inhibitor [Deltaproteobacteria bacterium]
MSKKPFFARFLVEQDLEEVAGGCHKKPVTKKYPSDNEDNAVTLKYPSDSDEYQTLKYPSDTEDSSAA